MEYRVLTVGREFGSGGAAIARKLAAHLGWKLLDNALVTQIAQAAQVDPALAQRCDERVDSWMHRVTRSGLWSGAFEAVAQPVGLDVFDAETMAEIANRLIREAAGEGNCVIVGRGGQCVLRSHAGVFHTYVYAPLAARIARVRVRPDAPDNLEEWIGEMDAMRKEYVTHHFGCEWANPHLYHLMIDSTLGEDAVVDAVLAAMRNPRRTR